MSGGELIEGHVVSESTRTPAQPSFDGERWRVTDRRGISIRWARVLMMDAAGRDLTADEHVHHINGDCTDDRIENLALVDIRDHGRHHGRQGWVARKAAWQYEWSAEHAACVECGTTERKHQGHGLCARCDARLRMRRRRAEGRV
jgi:hypothetical protein